jgi:hypothetical protein
MKASRPIHSPRRRATAGRAPKRQPARRPGSRPQGPGLLSGSLAFGLLALAVCGLVAAIALISGHQPTSAASSALQPCRAADVSDCSADAVWLPLRSTAPGDILAAARGSALFREKRAGSGDPVQDLSRLGTPVLVQPLRPSAVVDGQLVINPDFYVIPILNAAGATSAAAELELNPAHTAIHVIALVTYTQPRPQGQVAFLQAPVALATVATRSHVALRAGTQPRLVYISLDAQSQVTGQLVWAAGGEFPADPLWLVPGADGQAHLVGNDGNVYLPSQVPVQG